MANERITFERSVMRKLGLEDVEFRQVKLVVINRKSLLNMFLPHKR